MKFIVSKFPSYGITLATINSNTHNIPASHVASQMIAKLFEQIFFPLAIVLSSCDPTYRADQPSVYCQLMSVDSHLMLLVLI